MGDIYVGLLVLAVLALGLFLLGQAIGRRVSERSLNLWALATFAALVGYTVWLWDDMLLAQLLPVTNLIVVGNWFPLVAGFLGGLAFHQSPQRAFRCWLPITGLEIAAFSTVIWPLLGSTPACGDLWDQSGVCLQTTDRTCSAAAAATLLRCHGIPATEQEMAELCLTRQGTSWLGLYRGLRLKTANTPWDVEPFECSATDLQQFHAPVILSVGLPRHSTADPVFQTEWGWTPGIRHSVVLLRFLDAHEVEIGEPAHHIGRDRWTTEVMTQLYRGQGFRMVRRKSSKEFATKTVFAR